MATSSPIKLALVHGGDRSRSTINLRTIKPTITSSRSRFHHRCPPTVAAAGGGSPADNVFTFSSNISTDVPLHEPPGVSFDEYVRDRARVFRAMFPDSRRSRRLNDEEWMIEMLPIHFLFASVDPVVVMRLRRRSNGKEYPPCVPDHATTAMELEATRWELRGLNDIQMPPHFALSVQGVLYPDRSSNDRRLKGHLEMSISLILPPVLRLIPEDVLRSIADAVLRRLLEKMKHEVDVGLISDYANFRREKLKMMFAAASTTTELRSSSS
ncbi:uncharacterized protein LOC122042267 [Zingiber officinale]|uniref:uncharacterized protein LOC122042267 n=1 Tax=Zingiber officinale TaxID=94328 RepID=UPI001C4B2C72|nr:uncharacterized protein LOC122042267 [Zingiber officinale]